MTHNPTNKPGANERRQFVADMANQIDAALAQSDAEPSDQIAELEATIRTLRSSLVAALKRPAQSDAELVAAVAEEYAGRLHACLLAAGMDAPRQEWLAAHFRDAIAAALAQSDAGPVAWRLTREDIDQMLDAGCKEVDLSEIGLEDLISRKNLREFLEACLKAAPPHPDVSGLEHAETVIRAMVEACEDNDLDGAIKIARVYFNSFPALEG